MKSASKTKSAMTLLVIYLITITFSPFQSVATASSTNASCAAFVAQLTAESESNLGQNFKVLRGSGWEISAWPIIAKSSIQERIDQGRICD